MPAAPAGQKIDFGAINMQSPSILQSPQGVQPLTPDLFKARIVAKYPDANASDGRKYADIPAQELTQKIVDKYPQGVTNDGHKYSDFLLAQPTPEAPQITSSGTNIAPLNVEKARIGVKNSVYSIFQQAAQGGGEFIQGINDTAQNPIEGPIRAASGLATTALSPFAPVLNPIGNAINDKVVQPIANAYADLPQVQKFAQTPAAAGVEHAAEQVSRLTNIAGTVAGFQNPAKLKTEVGAVKTGVTDTVKSTGTAIHDAVTPSLEHDVGKALGFTGRMSGTTALEKTAQSTRALQTIVDNAPNLKVTDANGAEVPFNPSKATFVETLDAFNQTKTNIYKQYSDLAGTASDFTAEDFNKVQTSLENIVKNSTGSFKNKAAALVKDMQENYGRINPETGEVVYKNTPALDIQEFIQKINTDVNPLSDKAGAEVSMTASQAFRDIMDKKIETAPGQGYQDLRYKYADLKSIESDLVNQFKKAARGQGGTLAKVIEGFGGLDILVSTLKGDLAGGVYGAGAIGVGELLKYLKDPTKALQRTFQKLQSKSSALPKPHSPNITKPVIKSTAIETGIPQTAQKTIENHFTSAEQVLQENPKADLPGLIEQTRTNIAMSLEQAGLKDIAAKIKAIDLSAFKDWASFKEAILNYVKNVQPGLSLRASNPFNDFNSAQQAFLIRAGKTLKDGHYLTVKDWEMLKTLLKSKGYQVPSTQIKTGQMLYDMFKTTVQRKEILGTQKFDKQMLDKAKSENAQNAQLLNRDALGRFK